MDCAAEEQLIRLKLQELPAVSDLRFDLQNRTLEVMHSGSREAIDEALGSLRLDARHVSTDDGTAISGLPDHQTERKLLMAVLAINAFFFILELLMGFMAGSMGLVGDSLDMLADSIVYGLSLYAVGGAVSRKKRIAGISGYFQLALATMGLAEVVRRFVGVEEVPSYTLMIGISILALIGNALCLFLLQKSKSKEAHMQASMIFTSNDVIVNLGVIVAGVLVLLTHSNIPDLAVGVCIFALVARGAFRILRLAR